MAAELQSENINTDQIDADRLASLNELFTKIANNTTEPSTCFITNLEFIYTFPKQLLIDQLAAFPVKQISLLRQQIYNTLIDEFSWSILEENGFNLSNDHAFEQQLKKRGNPKYAAADVYNMGLSIVEKTIVSNLAKDIFKPPPGVKKQTQQAIIDTNSNLITVSYTHLTLPTNREV